MVFAVCAGLVQLEYLNLGWCVSIGDNDLKGLQCLTRLSELQLSRTKVPFPEQLGVVVTGFLTPLSYVPLCVPLPVLGYTAALLTPLVGIPGCEFHLLTLG